MSALDLSNSKNPSRGFAEALQSVMSDDSSDIRATLEWLHLIRYFYVFCNLDALETSWSLMSWHKFSAYVERFTLAQLVQICALACGILKFVDAVNHSSRLERMDRMQGKSWILPVQKESCR
eukprot:4214232-Amphidinium_carterae.1